MYANVGLTNIKIAVLSICALALYGGVIYSNSFEAPFLFDDVIQIEDKTRLRNLDNYFTPEIIISRRPLVEFTFALNYRFGKLNVFGYHLVDVFIHIINGILVYFLALPIIRRLIVKSENKDNSEIADFQTQAMALFAAVIFIAHPLQTQAVTYIAQRYSSLAAMFYMLSILLYINGRLRQKRIVSAFDFRILVYFCVSFVFGGLAFMSKENAASLPFAVLLVEFLLFDRTWKAWRRKLIWLLPAFVALAVTILYMSGFFRGDFDFGRLLEEVSYRSKETGKVSRWEYLCTQFNVVVIYVRLLFLPFGQNLDYVYPFKSGFFDGLTPLAFLFVVGLIFLGVWNLRRRPILTFGIFWFFIALSVESSIIPISDALFEHRLYLPMFGFALIIAYLVFCFLPVRRFWRITTAIVVIIALGYATYARNETYRDRVTLWADVVSKSPNNYRAHFNLGNALRDEHRLEDAIASYQNVLKIRSNYAKAHDNLGVVLMEKGEVDDAIVHFKKALKIRPRGAMSHCNLGIALMRKGQLEEAIGYFSKALQRKPTLVEARNNLGIALAQQGKTEEAIQHFSRALKIQPENAEVHANLGFALALQGKTDEGIVHLVEAIGIKPDYAEAHYRLGSALMQAGNYDRAITHFSKASELSPDLGAAREGLKRAIILNKRKRFE